MTNLESKLEELGYKYLDSSSWGITYYKYCYDQQRIKIRVSHDYSTINKAVVDCVEVECKWDIYYLKKAIRIKNRNLKVLKKYANIKI